MDAPHGRPTVGILPLMRTWKVLAAASAGLLLAGGFAPSPSVAAETTKITSLTVPSAPVDLEASPGAIIRAHITDPVGATPGDPVDEYDVGTEVCVTEAGSAWSGIGCHRLTGRLISGTPQDGEWEFQPFKEFSAYHGFEVRRLNVARLDGTSQVIDLTLLAFPRTFTTIGRHNAFVDRQSPRSDQVTTIVYGGTVTVRARLFWVDKRSLRRQPIAKQRVRLLQKDQADGDERLLATATTAADGSVAVTVKPARNAHGLYLRWDEGTTASGIRYDFGVAWTGRVDVKSRIGIRSKPAKLRVKQVGYIQGNVTPATPAAKYVYLQRYSRGAWRNVGSATIRGNGTFSLGVRPLAKGTFSYRVYKPGDARNAFNVTSAFKITSK